MIRAAAITLLSIAIAPVSGQTKSNTVTIYCSADEAFARPILAEFTKQTGIEVRPLFDTEAGKTTGLVHRLLSERARPRADVWWSSEIFGTIQLAEAGVLAAYEPPSAADIPAAYRDPKHYWTAFGLRGRVIAYNPEKTPKDRVPKTWAELARPEYKGKVAIANPIFGTTRGHMATLMSLWGEEAFREYLMALRDNGVRIADGNSQAVMMVARGEVEFAATDTDDVIVAIGRGDKVKMAFPDLDGPDGKKRRGTLWIPNSVAVVAGGMNADGARKLADYLVAEHVELKLWQSDSANIPVRSGKWSRPSRTQWEYLLKFTVNQPAKRRALDAYFQSKHRRYLRIAEKLQATDSVVKEILLR